MYAKKAVYKKKRVAAKTPKVTEPRLKEKQVKGEKNGAKRVVLAKKTVCGRNTSLGSCDCQLLFCLLEALLPH